MILFDHLTFKPIEIREETWDSEDEVIKDWLIQIIKLNQEIHDKLVERDILMCRVIINKQMTFSDYLNKLRK